MEVNGEAAARFDAVRLDSFAPVNLGGDLISANEETGAVQWKDRTGETKSVTLRAHTIKLVKKHAYGR